MSGPPPLPDDGKQIGLKIFSLVVGAGFVMTLALFGWTGPPFDTMYRDLNIQSPTQGFVPMSFCLMMGAAIAALIFFKDFFATRRRALGLNIALLILILVVYIFWMVLMMMPLWQSQSRGRAPKKRIIRRPQPKEQSFFHRDAATTATDAKGFFSHGSTRIGTDIL